MNEKKILIVIFLSAAVLRIGLNIVREKVLFKRDFLYYGEDYYLNKIIVSDAIWYNYTAISFLKGNGVSSIEDFKVLGWDNEKINDFVEVRKLDNGGFAHKALPPLYPLFLALCYYCLGMNTMAYFIPQLILGCLTCVFIYLLAKEIFGERVAVLSGFAVAFYLDHIFYTNFIRPETLFISLITLGFWLLIKGNSRKKISLILVSAIVFGLACLTRITFIPFIPLLFLWQVIFFGKDGKRNFKTAVLMVSLIFLVLLPWCLRNYNVFGKFTPFTDEINAVFIQDHTGRFSVANSYFNIYDSMVLRVAAYIKNNFTEYFLNSLKRFIVFWSPVTAEMKPIARIYKGLTWIIIFPLAFWGMIVAPLNWQKSGLIIMFIFFHALLHAGSWLDGGLVFRYPVQPFLCIFTAYGFWNIYEKIKYREQSDSV